MLRRLAAGFPPQWPGSERRSGHVWFVENKVALGQVFSEYFGFLCQFSSRRLLHIDHHHHLSFGDGTTGQIVADVPSLLSLTQPQEKIRNLLSLLMIIAVTNASSLPYHSYQCKYYYYYFHRSPQPSLFSLSSYHYYHNHPSSARILTLI
jgi:hypothetical protein